MTTHLDCPMTARNKALVDNHVYCLSRLSCPFNHLDDEEVKIEVDGKVDTYSRCLDTRGRNVKNMESIREGRIIQ